MTHTYMDARKDKQRGSLLNHLDFKTYYILFNTPQAFFTKPKAPFLRKKFIQSLPSCKKSAVLAHFMLCRSFYYKCSKKKPHKRYNKNQIITFSWYFPNAYNKHAQKIKDFLSLGFISILLFINVTFEDLSIDVTCKS